MTRWPAPLTASVPPPCLSPFISPLPHPPTFLASLQKINVKNSWSIPLIDHIDALVGVGTQAAAATKGATAPAKGKKGAAAAAAAAASSSAKRGMNDDDEGDDSAISMRGGFGSSSHAEEEDIEMTNFTRASCALDASIKIYSCRVDDVYSTSYRVLEGLSRPGAPRAGGEGSGAGEDEGGSGDGEDGTGAKGSRKGARARGGPSAASTTIEKNLASITFARGELVFGSTSGAGSAGSASGGGAASADPVFHKLVTSFDEAGLKGMLMHQLTCADGYSAVRVGSGGEVSAGDAAGAYAWWGSPEAAATLGHGPAISLAAVSSSASGGAAKGSRRGANAALPADTTVGGHDIAEVTAWLAAAVATDVGNSGAAPVAGGFVPPPAVCIAPSHAAGLARALAAAHPSTEAAASSSPSACLGASLYAALPSMALAPSLGSLYESLASCETLLYGAPLCPASVAARPSSDCGGAAPALDAAPAHALAAVTTEAVASLTALLHAPGAPAAPEPAAAAAAPAPPAEDGADGGVWDAVCAAHELVANAAVAAAEAVASDAVAAASAMTDEEGASAAASASEDGAPSAPAAPPGGIDMSLLLAAGAGDALPAAPPPAPAAATSPNGRGSLGGAGDVDFGMDEGDYAGGLDDDDDGGEVSLRLGAGSGANALAEYGLALPGMAATPGGVAAAGITDDGGEDDDDSDGELDDALGGGEDDDGTGRGEGGRGVLEGTVSLTALAAAVATPVKNRAGARHWRFGAALAAQQRAGEGGAVEAGAAAAAASAAPGGAAARARPRARAAPAAIDFLTPAGAPGPDAFARGKVTQAAAKRAAAAASGAGSSSGAGLARAASLTVDAEMVPVATLDRLLREGTRQHLLPLGLLPTAVDGWAPSLRPLTLTAASAFSVAPAPQGAGGTRGVRAAAAAAAEAAAAAAALAKEWVIRALCLTGGGGGSVAALAAGARAARPLAMVPVPVANPAADAAAARFLAGRLPAARVGAVLASLAPALRAAGGSLRGKQAGLAAALAAAAPAAAYDGSGVDDDDGGMGGFAGEDNDADWCAGEEGYGGEGGAGEGGSSEGGAAGAAAAASAAVAEDEGDVYEDPESGPSGSALTRALLAGALRGEESEGAAAAAAAQAPVLGVEATLAALSAAADGTAAASSSSAPVDDASLALITADRVVERIRVKYETVAKRVDVRALKEEMWTLLQGLPLPAIGHAELETDFRTRAAANQGRFVDVSGAAASEGAGAGDSSSGVAASSGMARRGGAGSAAAAAAAATAAFSRDGVAFCDTIRALAPHMGAGVSVAFYFITVLHLANEHGLAMLPGGPAGAAASDPLRGFQVGRLAEALPRAAGAAKGAAAAAHVDSDDDE